MRKMVLNKIIRAKLLQPVWEKVQSLSVVAQNFWGGAHFEDSGELWVLKNIIRNIGEREIIVFDVGANRGLYSLATLDVLGGNAHVYSFEPSGGTFKELENNVGHVQNIKAFNFGFSDRAEQLVLYSTKESNGLASVYGNNPLTEFEHQETISLHKLDIYCEEQNIQRIDFLKIDVEGHEYKVLLGARELLRSGKIKVIQFEIGECNIVSRTFFWDFYELLVDKYRIYRILPNGLREIQVYKTVNEVFACVNYLAILK
jgi:FkbM family methyltransferase